MSKEIFKSVIGYQDRYEISNKGNVKSLVGINERILKQCTTVNGYLYVVLYKNGTGKNCFIHSLVATSFLNHKPDGSNKVVIDHINNNRLDNRVENLQLITHRNNITKRKDASCFGTGVQQKGKRFEAAIQINGKRVYLGMFATRKIAGEAYQTKLKSLSK